MGIPKGITDSAAIISHQAADKVTTSRHIAGAVAIIHAGVRPTIGSHQAADITIISRHTAGAVAIIHYGAWMMSHQAADIVTTSRHTASAVTIIHGRFI